MKRTVLALLMLVMIAAIGCKKEDKYTQAEVWRGDMTKSQSTYYVTLKIEGQAYNTEIASPVVPTQTPNNVVWQKGFPQIILVKVKDLTVFKPKL